MKYELVPEGRRYRIKALKALPGVAVGDLGGTVEGPGNLSHEGNCWIFPGAEAWGNARITDNAVMRDDSAVWDCAILRGDGELNDNAAIFDYSQCAGSMSANSSIRERAVLGHGTVMLAGTLLGDQAALLSPCYRVIDGKTFTFSDHHISVERRVYSLTELKAKRYLVSGGDIFGIIERVARAHSSYVQDIVDVWGPRT